MRHLGAPRWLGLAAVLAGLGLGLPPAAGQVRHTVAEREAADRERQDLRGHIDAIQKEIAAAEKQRAEAGDALKASEQAISDATRKLAEIEARRDQASRELVRLEEQIGRLKADMGEGQKKLAELLRKQYASGGLTPWSALLSGDNPQESGRTMGYLAYVSQARTQAIQQVRTELAQLQQLQEQAAARRGELEELAGQQQAQRDERVRQQAERQRVLEDIGIRLRAQRKEASRLISDEERLTRLVADINRALAQQAADAARRRAEEARLAEERRAAQLARDREQTRLLAEKTARETAARQAREQALREGAQTPAPSGVRATLTEREAPDAAQGAGDQTAVAVVAPREPAAPAPVAPPALARAARVDFAGLRGQLPLPARGQLTGRFGQAREGGGTWRGIFIRAPEATPVHAVAPGTVVFSGWLRGFGNLLILDHGSEYLSVYGNNEAILKEVGDTVAAGEPVASAGSSGGQPESGIYFELRHRGTPVDPLLWAKLR